MLKEKKSGVIVAIEIDGEIRYVAYAARTVELLEYKVMFDLKSASIE